MDFELLKEDKSTVIKSIRIRASLLKQIEELSASSGVSINKIINESIVFALKHMNTESSKKKKSS